MLNMEAGGEVAERLDGLYTYVLGRCYEANAQRDAAGLDEAIKLLTPLRDAWAEHRSAEPDTLQPERHPGREAAPVNCRSGDACWPTTAPASMRNSQLLAQLEVLATRQHGAPPSRRPRHPHRPGTRTRAPSGRARPRSNSRSSRCVSRSPTRLGEARQQPGFAGVAERHRRACRHRGAHHAARRREPRGAAAVPTPIDVPPRRASKQVKPPSRRIAASCSSRSPRRACSHSAAERRFSPRGRLRRGDHPSRLWAAIRPVDQGPRSTPRRRPAGSGRVGRAGARRAGSSPSARSRARRTAREPGRCPR